MARTNGVPTSKTMKMIAGAMSAEARTRRLSKTSAPRLIRPRSATATTFFLRVSLVARDLSKLRRSPHGRDRPREADEGLPGRDERCLGAGPAGRRRGAHGFRRPVGMRQDDGAADGGGARGDHVRVGAHR